METADRLSIIYPGYFAVGVAADSRRGEFDLGNGQLMVAGVRPDAVFIGDSITHFWELQAYFGGSGKILINRGIGGDTAHYVSRRFAADTLQLKPSLIVLMIGTNDMGWSLEQLNDKITDDVCTNITTMAEQAREAGIALALGSLLPIWGPSFYPVPEFTARKNVQIVECNKRLKTIAEATGATYIDYHSQMLDSEGNLPRELADDGVHPHSAGYTIMAQALRAGCELLR